MTRPRERADGGLLVAAAAVPVYVADLVFDIPAEVTGWLERVFHLLPTLWSAVRRSDVDMPWDWLVGLFVFPGLVAMVLLWAVVRLTFRRTGVGGVLRRMEARPPAPATWPSSGWPTWCRRWRWPPGCRRLSSC